MAWAWVGEEEKEEGVGGMCEDPEVRGAEAGF